LCYTSRLTFLYLLLKTMYRYIKNRHGVVPVEPTEPTYVAALIFQDRKSLEAWSASSSSLSPPSQKQQPKVEFYEGTLVISSAEGA
jgi:hypothetical protein